ncbi:hypothetical protein [Desulfobotulus alkaliphilus]|uniref:hypothetical protein n=1 Tax=Desulfobotulus alkaliphilus TaxID=622671 RepID=UPI0011A1D793|nr:hypothetical protein [Desulfobotulus alkaliphilus]
MGVSVSFGWIKSLIFKSAYLLEAGALVKLPAQAKKRRDAFFPKKNLQEGRRNRYETGYGIMLDLSELLMKKFYGA